MLICAALVAPARAAEAQIVTLTLNVGEPYLIHDVDSGSVATVTHSDNSNSFIVKRTAPHDLTVFTFQKGEGTVEAKSHGEDVVYHVIVNGMVFDRVGNLAGLRLSMRAQAFFNSSGWPPLQRNS